MCGAGLLFTSLIVHLPLQLTALLTPALAMLAGDKSAKSVWAGCMVAMVGTVFFTLDNVPQVAPSANAAHIAVGETIVPTKAIQMTPVSMTPIRILALHCLEQDV